MIRTGRLWVAETTDFPNELVEESRQGRDRIKILGDTDGDGREDAVGDLTASWNAGGLFGGW